MISLSFFLYIWLILLGIYGLLSLISILQMIRFSIGGFVSFSSTLVFIAGVLLVVFATTSYLVQVDWDANLTWSSFFSASPLAL